MKTPISSKTGIFRQDIEKLFKRIIYISLFASLLTVFLQWGNGNIQELWVSAVFFIITGIGWLLFRFNYKSAAYHLLVIFTNLFFIYQIVFVGSRYQAILLFYACALIFCFIFFERFKILLFYLVFLTLSQIVIVYYNTDSHINSLSEQMIVEFVNVIAYNIIIFLLVYFYLSNLVKSKVKLDEAINNVKKQEVLLSHQNQELSKYIASNKQLENYTHLAAHELKAPLRSIQGFSSILGKKLQGQISPQDQELFNFISSGTSKMSGLLTDLGQLGRVSKMDVVLKPIDLEELFQEIIRDRGHTIKEKQAIVEYTTQEIKTIIGHRSLIKQLFSNLIGNGLKFVKKGTIPHVKIEIKEEGRLYYFKFMDNGIGIEPEYRDKIFQIFTRLHSEAQFEGSGIGLAICKKIVDLHQGTISIENSQLGGACFIVGIPKVQNQ